MIGLRDARAGATLAARPLQQGPAGRAPGSLARLRARRPFFCHHARGLLTLESGAQPVLNPSALVIAKV
jgi:hypothetical protein